MIYFLCPDTQRPIGGVKQLYRHASLLRRAGVEARILHTRAGFRCTWFAHDAALAWLSAPGPWPSLRARLGQRVPHLAANPLPQLRLGRTVFLEDEPGEHPAVRFEKSDVIVLPEFHGIRLNQALADLDVVIFNQNVHGTFRDWGYERTKSTNAYTHPRTRGAVCVSEHNETYLRHAFAHLHVERVTNGVDHDVFRPGPDPKPRALAFMPRKLGSHLEQVLQILHARGVTHGWELVPIDGLSEAEVVLALQRASIFLSSCSEEGFGLPPLEAALCGCVVVGYPGVAAREYFRQPHAWPVADGDVLAFAQAAEAAMASVRSSPDGARHSRQEFRNQLVERYSLARERQTVLRAWQALVPEAFAHGHLASRDLPHRGHGA